MTAHDTVEPASVNVTVDGREFRGLYRVDSAWIEVTLLGRTIRGRLGPSRLPPADLAQRLLRELARRVVVQR